MNDEEYLEKAGIDPQMGNESAPTLSEVESQPAQTSAPSAPMTPQEMFELGGHKFPTSTEFSILHNGNPKKVPYQNLVNTYRQAAHLNEKWGEAQKRLESVKDYDRYKGFYDKYGALQEWSEKNPKEWETLHNLWQNRDQHLLKAQIGAQEQGQSPFNIEPLVQEIHGLKQGLSKYESMFQEMEQRKAQEAEAKDIDFIKGEISSFGKEFPEVNLDEKDPDGLPLWAKITQWGQANGYHEFTPAAHMYLKQRIADVWATRARSEAMKAQKGMHKEGIIKRSAQPITMGQGQDARPINIRKSTYNSLADDAKAEIAQGMYQ